MIAHLEKSAQELTTDSHHLKDESNPTADTSEKRQILFVDDDPDVIRINKIVLEHIGYDVTTSTRSTEALALFKSCPEKFDLVITDLTMPELSGFDLTRELLAIRNDISIIICSGYTSDETEDEIKAAGAKAFITKPATMQTITSTVKNVLT